MFVLTLNYIFIEHHLIKAIIYDKSIFKYILKKLISIIYLEKSKYWINVLLIRLTKFQQFQFFLNKSNTDERGYKHSFLLFL